MCLVPGNPPTFLDSCTGSGPRTRILLIFPNRFASVALIFLVIDILVYDLHDAPTVLSGFDNVNNVLYLIHLLVVSR